MPSISGKIIHQPESGRDDNWRVVAQTVDGETIGEGPIAADGTFQIGFRRSRLAQEIRRSGPTEGPPVVLTVRDSAGRRLETTGPRHGKDRLDVTVELRPIRRDETPTRSVMSVRGSVTIAAGIMPTDLHVGVTAGSGRTDATLAVAPIAPDATFEIELDEKRLGRTADVGIVVLRRGGVVHRPDTSLKVMPGVHLVSIALPGRLALRRPNDGLAEAVPIEELARAGLSRVADREKVTALLARSGIKTLGELVPARGKLGSIGLTDDQIVRLEAAAKFRLASGSPILAGRLVRAGYRSLERVASVPEDKLADILKVRDDNQRRGVERLHAAAAASSGLATATAADRLHDDSVNASWGRDDDDGVADQCPSCDGCNSVFSPIAYLFDLLDLVFDHWGVTSGTLERLFRQEIDGLECEPGLAPIHQVRLAAEVLEAHLSAGGRSISPATADCRQLWLDLLTIDMTDLPPVTGAPEAVLADDDRASAERVAAGLRLPATVDVIVAIHGLLAEPDQPDLAAISPTYANTTGQFGSLLDATFETAMAVHRDALIDNSGSSADDLGRDLFIDLRGGPCAVTNRITQAVQSLQEFVLRARTGHITEVNRPDVSGIDFDPADIDAVPLEEYTWRWLRDYQTWASAIYALVYTENILPPPFEGTDGPNYLYGEGAAYADAVQSLLQPATDPMSVRRVYLDWVLPTGLRDAFLIADEDLMADPAVRRTLMIEPDDREPYELGEWLHRVNQLVDILAIRLFTSIETGWAVDDDHLVNRDLYFPLVAGWALNRAGEYAAANDWYRAVHDPNGRHDGFPFDEHFSDDRVRTSGWFDDVLSPHELARRRTGVYRRHVLLVMARNLIDWADHEYALASPVTVDRARTLYQLAGEALGSTALADRCGRTLDNLRFEVVTGYRLVPEVDVDHILVLLDDLNIVRDVDILDGVVASIRRRLVDDPGNLDPIATDVASAVARQRRIDARSPIGRRYAESRAARDRQENDVMLRGRGPGAPWVRLATDRFAIGRHRRVPVLTSVDLCVPANPVLQVYAIYVELSLLKLRLCLDIAGEPLPSETLSESTGDDFLGELVDATQTELTQTAATVGSTDQPRYRYSFLSERAKRHAELAQRLGSALLAAHERRDDEAQRRLQAEQALDLSEATTILRQLGFGAARDGVEIARLQSDKAAISIDFWQDRIDAGMLSATEQTGLSLMVGSGILQGAAAVVHGIGAIVAFVGAGVAGGAAGGTAGTTTGPQGTVGGAAAGATGGFALGAALSAAIPGTGAALQAAAGALGTFGSVALTTASFERRWEDWNHQRDLAQVDVQLADAQEALARQQSRLAAQELSVARLGETHARQLLDFLAEKFTNAELYQWLVTVLGQEYRTVLQIATSSARAAQRALEFERQEPIGIVQSDYWSAGTAGAADLSDEQRQSGLLGAERLLSDLSRLDHHKVTADRRRLELTKNISLARVMPDQLVELRTTGRATFNTLLSWFDEDHPGHYLRLIKAVRVTVLAIVPPIDGIHATLSNPGLSSVVVKRGFDTFDTVRSMRNYAERIAIDAPFQDSGLFVFDHQDPMFLPFEGLGVETSWTLELPRSTNAFDFGTIADVMLTIDYTAIHDDAHEAAVRERLGPRVSADVILTARHYAPDAWYEFLNPLPGVADSPSRQLTLEVVPPSLPPQLVEGTAETLHVSVLIDGDFSDLDPSVRARLARAVAVERDGLRLTSATPTGGAIGFGSVEVTKQAIMATTRTSSVPAPPLIGPPNSVSVPPDGTWTVTVTMDLPEEVEATFGRLNDVVVVLSVEGDRHSF